MENDRRNKILEAAERLVSHYGIAKTTISDIAREARCGVGTVYLEFTSKDDIVGRLARDRHAAILDAMRTSTAEHDAFEEKFRAMMNARVRAFIEIAGDGAHAADLVHCGGCEAVKTEFMGFDQAQRQILAEFLAAATSAGVFRLEDSVVMANTILRAYATFTPPILYTQTFTNLFGELDHIHDLLLQGLKAR